MHITNIDCSMEENIEINRWSHIKDKGIPYELFDAKPLAEEMTFQLEPLLTQPEAHHYAHAQVEDNACLKEEPAPLHTSESFDSGCGSVEGETEHKALEAEEKENYSEFKADEVESFLMNQYNESLNEVAEVKSFFTNQCNEFLNIRIEELCQLEKIAKEVSMDD